MGIWRILTVLCLTIGASSGGKQDGQNWLTGKALEKAARSNAVSGNWTQAPLGQQLTTFAKAQNISIVLDRRVDSGQMIELRAVDLTVEQFLWRVARGCNLGVCQIGDSFYLGPPDVAAALPVMLNQFESQNLKSAKDWKKVTQLTSDRPFEPAIQLKSLCAAAGIEIENLERLPMDFWAPMDWPSAPTYQNISLLLVGFGLWPECHGTSLRITEFHLPENLKRQFRLPDQSGVAKQLKALREKFPQANLQPASSGVTIESDPTTVNQFAETVAFMFQPAAGADANKRYSLKTDAMRGSILATIAQQAGLELQFPAEMKSKLSERIQINLEQVPLAELIETTLKGSGLEYELKDGKLLLRSEPEPDHN